MTKKYIYLIEEKREEYSISKKKETYWVIIGATSSEQKAKDCISKGKEKNLIREYSKIQLNDLK